MCLIYQRKAGVILDKDDFLVAVQNNPHGYGLAVPERDGFLSVYKSVPEEGVDAEKLYNLIHEDFADDDIMLHLRYTTAGETSLRNAHPFPILEKGRDGVDLRMAHNGTIFRRKPAANSSNKWESDTRVFVREFVRPLAKRFIHQYPDDEIVSGHMLNDEFFASLLNEEIPNASVLSFIDGYGNTLEVNGEGNGGKYEDGYWVSNVYSFNKDHREKKKTGVVQYPGAKAATPSQTTTNGPTSSQTELGTEVKFTEKFDITVEDLWSMTDATIEVLVDEEPDDAALLIKELLFLFRDAHDKQEDLYRQLKRSKGKHEAASKKIEELQKGVKNGEKVA